MFPDPCGVEFEEKERTGANPATLVPDNFRIVRGGNSPLPPAGEVFSGAVGPTLEAAAAAVPHGTIRTSTCGEIRLRGGTVEWRPEISRHGTINRQHVNVTEPGDSAFGEPVPNPVTARSRIDGDKRK